MPAELKRRRFQRDEVGCLGYLIGILSFIPLFGVPAGIFAIIWGIRKWHTGGKKLVGLGAAGILVTVGLYSYLIPELDRLIQSDEAEALRNFPFQVTLQDADLPEEWYGVRPTDSLELEPPDARFSVVRFEIDPNDSVLNVQQQLTVFQSIEQARQTYKEWSDKWTPTEDWKRPPKVTFVPKDQNDDFLFECINVNRARDGSLLSSCRVIQRHENVLSLIITNIDYKTLTLEQFEHALAQMDQRMNQWSSQTTPASP